MVVVAHSCKIHFKALLQLKVLYINRDPSVGGIINQTLNCRTENFIINTFCVPSIY